MGDFDLILERLCRVARTGRRVALLFDYDGTLAPVRPTPAEATLPPATRRGLERLVVTGRVTIGVVIEVAFVLYAFVLGRAAAARGLTGLLGEEDRGSATPVSASRPAPLPGRALGPLTDA